MLVVVLVGGGALASVVGLYRWLEPMWDATGHVSVPMHLTSSDGQGADLRLEVDLEPYPGVSVSGVPTGGLPHLDHYTTPLGVVTVHVDDASRTEQLFSQADDLLRGVALLLAALALRPMLVATAQGRQFQPGCRRRLHVVAVCVVLGGYVAPLLPWWASASVLDRLDDAYGMAVVPQHHLEVFVVAALVVLVGAVLDATAPKTPDSTEAQVPDLDGLGRQDQSTR